MKVVILNKSKLKVIFISSFLATTLLLEYITFQAEPCVLLDFLL